MEGNGDVTPAQAAEVDFAAIKFAAEKNQNSVRYFTDWALPQLDLLLPDNTQPIEVWTTLDPKMQAAATKAIETNTPKGAQGALVSLDRDGAVLAMVGDGLRHLQLQPRRQCRAPAGFGLEAVRLSGRAGSGLSPMTGWWTNR